MGILDFREIPSASPKLRKARKQALMKEELDAFEKFAEEYFEKILGGVVVSRTTRGPDNDMDLGVIINGERVLVSCKHYAHSDDAVGADDEHDPVSAIYSNGCTKFVGFYSSVPSSALVTKLEGLKSNKAIGFDYEILKNSDIESRLLDKDSVAGWLFAARYFPRSYANLFRRFVVPIEHYKEKDLKRISANSWSLKGPFGGIHSACDIDKESIIRMANDSLTNSMHASFFLEALKNAIDCFPKYFNYRDGADINFLELKDICPAWDEALEYSQDVDCNLPIMVCSIWSYWCPRKALEKYLIFADAYKLTINPPDNKNLIIAEAYKEVAYSSFLTIGNVARMSSGEYRDIFARLTAFSQLTMCEYTGRNVRSFENDEGKPIVWRFKVGEGLEFISDRILGRQVWS
ncbi:restriction endonuclease [Pseudomonas fluorescens]|uniref:restriction endonuclease n=1 Tax=Pseudomonas fluorescens TaxID=294 RepID=UPI0017803F21|nr:restriction endonuclease [Pseudomonas fluorescens]